MAYTARTPCSPNGVIGSYDSQGNVLTGSPGILPIPYPYVQFQNPLQRGFVLYSPQQMAAFEQVGLGVTVNCFWNNVNCWNGVSFYGWQAWIYHDQYGAPRIIGSDNTLYNPSWLVGAYLASGNSVAWNNWFYLSGQQGPEPPTGYVPLFQDLPDVKTLAVGVNVQHLPSNLKNVYKLTNTGAFSAAYGGPYVYPPGGDNLLVNANDTPWQTNAPTGYEKAQFVVAEYPDMATGAAFPNLPAMGQQQAGSPLVNPTGCIVDWTHRQAFNWQIGSGNIPTGFWWDTAWMDQLPKPFILPAVGSILPVGQAITISPYGYLPSGIVHEVRTGGQSNVKSGQAMLYMPYGGMFYVVPRGLAFGPSFVEALGYPPPNPANFSLLPPAEPANYGLWGVFPSSPGGNLVPVIVNGFLGTTYYSNALRAYRRILFFNVPMTGQGKSYTLYSSGFSGALPLNADWTVSRQP